MKSLLLAALFLAPAGPDAWWNKEWKFRRPVTITNRLERVLDKGFTVQVEIDPDYLGIREKSKAGLEDWAFVRGGERVPFLLQPGKGKSLLLCFRTAAELKAGASENYYLYYGSPSAEAIPVRPDQVYELWEDFSRPEALTERFQVDKDLTVAVQDGALLIREVAAGRNLSSPARLIFRDFPRIPGFELSFDLEMDSTDASGAGFAATVDLKEAGANDPSIGKKAEQLIEQLGDDAWQAREKATKELIALGRPAVAKVTEAARSGDAEVKWRAAHVLKEIAERSPAPVVSVGVLGGDLRMPVADAGEARVGDWQEPLGVQSQDGLAGEAVDRASAGRRRRRQGALERPLPAVGPDARRGPAGGILDPQGWGRGAGDDQGGQHRRPPVHRRGFAPHQRDRPRRDATVGKHKDTKAQRGCPHCVFVPLCFS
jgi:hypothetical protein